MSSAADAKDGAHALLLRAVRRFPLVPRPRPRGGALTDRIADLRARADRAERELDLVTASSVCNLAALIAADAGLPETARALCVSHARAFMDNCPLDDSTTRHALEPIVNLARLHLRDGDGAAAHDLVETLNTAVVTRTAASFDGVTVPGDLVRGPVSATTRWLWTVRLATAARGLLLAGRHDDAVAFLTTQHGIGERLLDGRQVAVLAHVLDHDTAAARDMLRTTTSGGRWERAVAGVLALMAGGAAVSAADVVTRIERPHADPLFCARLAFATIDILGAHRLEAGSDLVRSSPVTSDDDGSLSDRVVESVVAAALLSEDGHAAREILTHPPCRDRLTESQQRILRRRVRRCGLEHGTLTDAMRVNLSAVTTRAETVVVRALRRPIPIGGEWCARMRGPSWVDL